MQRSETQEQVLSISDLKVTFHTYAGDVKALDGVELSINKGEIFGLVGESGCGKSVTTLSIIGLLPQNAEIVSGHVLFSGTDLLKMKKEQMRHTRLKDIAIVFQDPMTYLNPVLRIGVQLTDMMTKNPRAFAQILIQNRLREIDSHAQEGSTRELQGERANLLSDSERGRLRRKDFQRFAREYALFTLRSVRLPEPEKIMKMFPFELSGGMRQRVMIAIALIRRPKLLLADEMTTALDVTVQAQVLQLLKELKGEIDASVLLITHDLAVVAQVCDRVAVMYAGNIVEVAPVEELFKNPLHPYTKGLLASIPRIDSEFDDEAAIKGSVPDLIFPPSGCRFHPRCPKAFELCSARTPELLEISPGHKVSCFLYGS
ncbi:MAG: ABC transporter ATP-binding protein [Nitrososphaerales archaeon]